MSAAPVRFLFDTDFLAPKVIKAAKAVALDVHETALADAEASGFRRGEADGRRASREADAARLTAAIETLGRQFALALADADVRAAEVEAEAVTLALAFARRLSAAAVARFPLAEIEAAAAACFMELRAAPHLVARVAPDFVEGVRSSLSASAQEKGFSGRLVVLGDPDIAEGDARLEWADGGMVRDAAAAARAVDRAVAQCFDLGAPAPDGLEPDQGQTP